jgi:hypothetical protein
MKLLKEGLDNAMNFKERFNILPEPVKVERHGFYTLDQEYDH